MLQVTDAAAAKLQALILEHPEDPIVRVGVQDMDESRLRFNITLESDPYPDDMIHESNGLTLAIERASAPRLDGITLDFTETEGFRFTHPDEGEEDVLRLINPD